MANATKGDTVQVHYTGKFEDGTVFDSSEGSTPLTFTLGEGRVIPGFEHAILGMEPGETRTTTVPAEDAYGPYRDDMVVQVDRTKIPDNLNPEKGQQLHLRQEDGSTIPVVVADVSNSSITIDANHPLAGKTLVFDIELVEIG